MGNAQIFILDMILKINDLRLQPYLPDLGLQPYRVVKITAVFSS